jgi:hypothetical protein
MNGGMFLLQNDGQLLEMSEQAYDSEDLLQDLLAKYPHLLAGDQIDNASPRRWLLVMREAGVPGEEGAGARWSVDHLFVDQDAIPTLVEVKRSTDTRIRREVVGQMLDYAANAVVYWPVETIRAAFDTTCQAASRDPGDVFRECFGPDVDEEAFWQSVKTNLQAGRVRMLFVADEIPDELRRVVEFLNAQMDPAEVLAIEIRQFVGQNLKTLVPRVIGQTATAEQKKRTTRQTKQWDEPSFFQELENRRGKDEVAVARKILEWARSRVTRVWWGKGSTVGSFVPVFNHKRIDFQLFAVWTYGTVEVYFQWFMNKPPFDSEELRRDLLSRLNEIPGISHPPVVITKRPSIPLTALVSEPALNRFLAAMDWFIEQTKAERE